MGGKWVPETEALLCVNRQKAVKKIVRQAGGLSVARNIEECYNDKKRYRFSLSRNPVAHQAATGFLITKVEKISSNKRECEFFHFHFASFLRFMAANLSFTQFVTWAKPLYCV